MTEAAETTPATAEDATTSDPFRADLHQLVRIALELGEVLGQAYAEGSDGVEEPEPPVRTWLVYTHGRETPATVRSAYGPHPSPLGEGYVCIGKAHFSAVRSIEEGPEHPSRSEDSPARPGDDDFALANGEPSEGALLTRGEFLDEVGALRKYLDGRIAGVSNTTQEQAGNGLTRGHASDQSTVSTLQQVHHKAAADSRSLLHSRAQTLRSKANLLDSIACRLPDTGGEMDEELTTLLACGLDRY